jgi:hypothetical protein
MSETKAERISECPDLLEQLQSKLDIMDAYRGDCLSSQLRIYE